MIMVSQFAMPSYYGSDSESDHIQSNTETESYK